ncbi:hypothetical protein [Spiroplasma clarkii]|nr:hypothetical protein [Spiroplasma clarkii]
MKSISSLMVSNPRMVKTDLYNMPHDYIGNLHSTKAMTNLNDIKLDGTASKDLSGLGVKIEDKKMIAPNGKVMATEWGDFVDTVKAAWNSADDDTYGKPVSKTAIDDIAIYENQQGKNVDLIISDHQHSKLTWQKLTWKKWETYKKQFQLQKLILMVHLILMLVN